MTNQQVLSQQVEDLGKSFGLIEAFLTSLESRLIDAQTHIAELTEDVAESQVDLTPLISKVTEVKNFAAGLNPESPTPPAEEAPDPEIPAPGEEPAPVTDPEEPAPAEEDPAAEEPAPEQPEQVAPENPAPAPEEPPFPDAR